MTAVQWIPFSLAFLHTYLERGRRRDLLLAIGFFSLQALSSGHGAAYLFVVDRRAARVAVRVRRRRWRSGSGCATSAWPAPT